nr:hypothetical protein [Sphingobium lignivorans]
MIVTLANLVVQTARGDKSSNGTPVVIDESAIGIVVPNGSGSAQPSANEPLADLGVTPTADSAAAPAPQSTAPSGAVPDLEPDPRLRERMDQDADRTNSTR